jgi:LPXTG-motif cell wall-anchored protein
MQHRNLEYELAAEPIGRRAMLLAERNTAVMAVGFVVLILALAGLWAAKRQRHRTLR